MRYLLILALLVGCGQDEEQKPQESPEASEVSREKTVEPLTKGEPKPSTETQEVLEESEPVEELGPYVITDMAVDPECPEGYWNSKADPQSFDWDARGRELRDYLVELGTTEITRYWMGSEIVYFVPEEHALASTSWMENNGYPDAWKETEALGFCVKE